MQEGERERVCGLGWPNGFVVDQRLREPLPRVHLANGADVVGGDALS
jgi:hypothetical protein